MKKVFTILYAGEGHIFSEHIDEATIVRDEQGKIIKQVVQYYDNYDAVQEGSRPIFETFEEAKIAYLAELEGRLNALKFAIDRIQKSTKAINDR